MTRLVMLCFECSFLFAFDIFFSDALLDAPLVRHHLFLRLITDVAAIVFPLFSDGTDFVKKHGKVCPYNSVGTLTYLGYYTTDWFW